MVFRLLFFIWRALGRTLFWLGWPVFWLLLQRTWRTRVLVRYGDSVLVVRGWLSDGRWGLPGGGLHRGEAPAVGAARELFEETGIRVEPPALMPLGDAWVRHRGLQYHCSYFATMAERGDLQPPKQLEIIHVAWVPVAELLSTTAKAEVFEALERTKASHIS